MHKCICVKHVKINSSAKTILQFTLQKSTQQSLIQLVTANVQQQIVCAIIAGPTVNGYRIPVKKTNNVVVNEKKHKGSVMDWLYRTFPIGWD